MLVFVGRHSLFLHRFAVHHFQFVSTLDIFALSYLLEHVSSCAWGVFLFPSLGFQRVDGSEIRFGLHRLEIKYTH